jgi:alkylglycerol monooxygenase
MDIMIYAIPVFFILIGIELVVERVHQAEYYRLNDAMSNISCGIVQQVTGIFFKVISLGVYTLIYQHYRFLSIEPRCWSNLLLFIGVDFFYYWAHRKMHEVNAFWGTHVVHHQSEEYNLSVALRQSSLQVFVSVPFYIPLALLGFNPAIFFLINTLQTLFQFWIHTEAIRKLPKWFEYIFNTPSHHRVHHGRNPEYIDKNHGGTLILFDRMFGTFESEVAPVVYGVTKPLETFDPIWANIDYYKDVVQQVKIANGPLNKLRTLINKPGWRSMAQGGPLQVPEITRDEQKKYHVTLPNSVNVYLFVQYVIMLLLAVGYLLVQPKLGALLSWEQFSFAGLILLSSMSLGLLSDRRSNAFSIEIFRLLLLPILLHLLFGHLILSLSCFAVSLLSVLVFQRFKVYYN